MAGVTVSPQQKPHLLLEITVHSPRSLLALFTLRSKSVSQLLCTQTLPHSFSKMPGVTLSSSLVLKSYLNFDSSGRSYRSFLPLFAPRVFPNSFIHNRFRTLSIKCRGVPLPFTIWNRPTPFSSVLLARLGHHSL